MRLRISKEERKKKVHKFPLKIYIFALLGRTVIEGVGFARMCKH